MKTFRMLPFLLVLLILVAAVPTALVLAQTGGQENPGGSTTSGNAAAAVDVPITVGTPVTVHLQGTTPVNLSYKSAGGETINVMARSLEPEGALDPTLTVLDSGGTTLAFNDDHRTNRTDLALRDALISQLTLDSAGLYTIQVASFSPDAQGDVEVTLTTGSDIPVQVQDQQPPPDQTISDRVPANGNYTTTMQGSAGDVVTITVRSTDNQFDPKVSLKNSSGTEVASNDDHETADLSLGPYDLQIVNFTLPATDTYTIEISGFAGIGGTFDLTISRGTGSSPQPTPVIQPTQSPRMTRRSMRARSIPTTPIAPISTLSRGMSTRLPCRRHPPILIRASRCT